MSRASSESGTEPVPRAHKVLLPLELQDYRCRCTRCKQVFADDASYRRQHLRPGTRCKPRSTTELYARLRLANHPTSPWALDPRQAASLSIREQQAGWVILPKDKATTPAPLEELPQECRCSLSVLMVHFLGVPRDAASPPDKRWLKSAVRQNARKLRVMVHPDRHRERAEYVRLSQVVGHGIDMLLGDETEGAADIVRKERAAWKTYVTSKGRLL